MKDYHDMLNSLKNKVVDAAGKAGETVTNAANKVVSDEMRDKVAGAAHAVGDRAKYASRMTRMTVDCNAELERVKRTYTEIGRLYYENYRDTADAFLAELCQQVTDANARVAELEAQMDELRAAAKEYRPAPDLHTVDTEVVEDELYTDEETPDRLAIVVLRSGYDLATFVVERDGDDIEDVDGLGIRKLSTYPSPVIALPGGLALAAFEMAEGAGLGRSLDAGDIPTLFGEDQARYLVAVTDPVTLIAKAQEAGLHASVVGRARGTDFASTGKGGDLFRLPLAHLREMHESWMPNWIEG